MVRTCSRYVSRFEYFDKAADSWFNGITVLPRGRVCDDWIYIISRAIIFSGTVGNGSFGSFCDTCAMKIVSALANTCDSERNRETDNETLEQKLKKSKSDGNFEGILKILKYLYLIADKSEIQFKIDVTQIVEKGK